MNPFKVLFLVLLAPQALLAQNILAGDSILKIEDFYDENIPLLIINTTDSLEPTYDKISAPEGLWGASITNATKVPGSMNIMHGHKKVYQSGEFVKGQSGLTLKVRGNTSAYDKKKPYKIKLQQKADLLLRENEAYHSHKDWALIYGGALSTRTVLGLWINELLRMQWTPQYAYVNLIMNGTYRGLYLLIENVECSPSRLHVDKQTGYVLEYDAYWWNENLFVESLHSKYMNYTFKYPEEEDLSNSQLSKLKEEIEVLESSIESGTYPDYLDVNSFSSWLLAHDLLGTWDSGGSNIFLTKYDNTLDSKWAMGNLWDFDTIERTKNTWARIHTDGNAFYFPKLFSSPNPLFTKTYINKWTEVNNTLIQEVLHKLDSLQHSPMAHSINRYYPLDETVSGWKHLPIASETDNHKNWIIQRKRWMDEAISNLSLTIDISEIETENASPVIYNVFGQKVEPTYQGITIYRGKKYLLPKNK